VSCRLAREPLLSGLLAEGDAAGLPVTIHVEQGKDEGARECARRETDRLAGIIRSAL